MTTRIATSPVVWVGVIVGALIGAAEYASGNGLGSAVLGGSIPTPPGSRSPPAGAAPSRAPSPAGPSTSAGST
jgi:hypothetical protein